MPGLHALSRRGDGLEASAGVVIASRAMNDGPLSPPGPLRVLPGIQAPKPMTVAELNRTVKGTVEERFTTLWVEGEVTTVMRSAAGHVYFDLKDDAEEARVSCVMFKGYATRSRATFVKGERLVLKAKASLHVARGQFQLVAEFAQPSGAGAAAAALAALKEKLLAEGLFAPERKRPLRRFPRTIGVVTSATGAAFGDICRTVHRRWPARIVIAPTLVQGADAPAQIVKALAAIHRVRGLHVVIIGRGGGASEDLAAFNDERVARAIAACRVPVISAVGHEVDNTVADLVADHRASTPTAAAELCTPVFSQVRDDLDATRRRLGKALLFKINKLALALKRNQPRDPRRRVDEMRQRLDELQRSAEDALRDRIARHRETLDDAEKALALAHPRARLDADATELTHLSERLAPALARIVERRKRDIETLDDRVRRAIEKRLDKRRQALGLAAGRLDALSPVAILARGYGVVLHEGRALTRSSEVTEGDSITVRLHDGSLDARVETVRR